MTRGKTVIIQGGQYGSEGKGQIAAAVAESEHVWAAVRTGSINAGHTVYKDGKKFVMQIIPTAWIHRGVTLVLGAGCYIEPSILAREVKMILDATGEDITRRLFIDEHCVWFGDAELERAKAANRHHAMGATGKGASEGIISKMKDRGSDLAAQARLFLNHPEGYKYLFEDTVDMLNRGLNLGQHVLLEGTQGALLDFNTGPYPFVTTRMTNSAAWLAEAGLPPINVHTVLVLRSHPIRVAGNSGPMPDEISWPELARSINETLKIRGKDPFIEESAIVEFEMALTKAVIVNFPDAVESIGPARVCRFHEWSDEERQEFRVCLSEANAKALAMLTPEILAKLKFFEMTTVTKKLRRVSRFNLHDAKRAIAMNGPVEIAYTFLNYDMPDLTGERELLTIDHAAGEFLNDMEQQLRVPIRYVTTERYQDTVIDRNRY